MYIRVPCVPGMLVVLAALGGQGGYIQSSLSPAPCCFCDPTFSLADIKTKNDIQYGSAYNSKTKRNQKLLLNVYIPPDNGNLRPIAPSLPLRTPSSVTARIRLSLTDLCTNYLHYSLTELVWGRHRSWRDRQASTLRPPTEGNTPSHPRVATSTPHV